MKSHRVRGAVTASAACLALGALMFLPRFSHFGAALGFLLTVAVAIGLLDLFGALKIEKNANAAKGDNIGKESAPRPAVELGRSWWIDIVARFDIRILYTGLSLCMAGACRISVVGTPGASAPWSGPTLIGLGIAAIALAWFARRRVPFDGDLHERFLVFGLAVATIMSTLGSQGLWDCWETHYGEVARRQLEQDDWISLFWEDEWFYSKPILIFWMMNLGMALFNVPFGPDQIPDHAEWGVRFFVGALGVAVLVGLYELLARRVSKRAGLFAAVILGTMPLFGFMVRQAITDLPFVGFMTLAVILFLLGLTADPKAEVSQTSVPVGRKRRVRISAFHAVVAGYVLAALPQFAYIATRSETYLYGTLGRDNVKPMAAAGRLTGLSLSDVFRSAAGVRFGGAFDISLDWLLLGLAFAAPFFVVIYSMRRERRVSKLCFHGMYLFLALATMAKGLGGVAIPVLGLIGFWIVAAPWSGMKGMRNFIGWHLEKARQIDAARGAAFFLLIASPWYVAMTVRHGVGFFNRFFIHDHLKRLSIGVHGETGTFQYYLQQLGYASFPWIALLPLAFLAWPRNDDREPHRDSKRTILVFSASLALVTFGLITMMVTKFHHYTLPLLPPLAILLAIFADEAWEERAKKIWPAMAAGAALLVLVAKDLVSQPEAGKGVLDGYAQLIGLFIYKYSRPYPSGAEYDFHLPLIVFSGVFAIVLLGWASRARRLAMALTVVAALAFGHWTVQHYMVKLAPHWTQKHLVQEYYKRRNSPDERLVAFQMNWKGENFYTGNRVVVHVSTTNKDFEKWVADHRGERHFFITEHARWERMSKRAAAASGPLKPFPDSCNKYRAGWADKL